MIKPITGTENFDAAIAKGDVVVGFSAPWCGRTSCTYVSVNA